MSKNTLEANVSPRRDPVTLEVDFTEGSRTRATEWAALFGEKDRAKQRRWLSTPYGRGLGRDSVEDSVEGVQRLA